MTWTGSGRKTAALCAAVVLLGTLAIPAHAAPPASIQVPAVHVPAAPQIPSPDEIAAAKASESATAAQVATIDRLLADASAAQDASLAASLQANNAYGEALVELQLRRDAAAVAAARASAAGEEQEKTRKQIGQLAGDLYRSGGLNPALSSFVTGTGNALQQAATLEAVTAGRTRAFQSAETAAVAAESLTAAAADANRAADEAARTAEARKLDAERASDAQRQAVSEARAQRTVLVDQLANLKNTTVALESARVDALDRQRQQDRLAAVTAAAAQGQGQAPGPRPELRLRQLFSGNPASTGTGRSPPAGSARPVPAGHTRSGTGLPGSGPAGTRTGSATCSRSDAAPAPAPGGSNQTAISVALGKVGAPYFYQYGGTGRPRLRLLRPGAERVRRGRKVPAAHGVPAVRPGARARSALPGPAGRPAGLGFGTGFLPRGDLPRRRPRGPGAERGRRNHRDGPWRPCPGCSSTPSPPGTEPSRRYT